MIIFKYLKKDSNKKYFEISILLVLHFLLVRTSLKHISANFEEKKIFWGGYPCSMPRFKLELC